MPEGLEFLDDLYAFALRLTQNRERAEDLVQETYLRHLSSGRSTPVELRPYLFRTLRNLHIDQWRRTQKGPATGLIERLPEAADVVLEGMLSEWMEEALTQLDGCFRETLWLREVEGFSYAEIASITGVPVNTVRSRLSRARQQLEGLLTYRQAPSERVAL